MPGFEDTDLDVLNSCGPRWSRMPGTPDSHIQASLRRLLAAGLIVEVDTGRSGSGYPHERWSGIPTSNYDRTALGESVASKATHLVARAEQDRVDYAELAQRDEGGLLRVAPLPTGAVGRAIADVLAEARLADALVKLTPGPGRPAIGPATKLRLPPELTAELDARAEAAEVSRAEIIRRLLGEALR